MPRPRQQITQESLPAGYENFVPLPTGAFPICPAPKEKIDWQCIVCGFIDTLSVDNMKAKPKKQEPLAHGTGCKACKSAQSAIAAFSKYRAAPWLTITGWYFNHDHELSRDRKRRFESIVFKGLCESGHPQIIPTLKLKNAHCSGSMIPDTNVGGKIATINEVSDDQKATFFFS